MGTNSIKYSEKKNIDLGYTLSEKNVIMMLTL